MFLLPTFQISALEKLRDRFDSILENVDEFVEQMKMMEKGTEFQEGMADFGTEDDGISRGEFELSSTFPEERSPGDVEIIYFSEPGVAPRRLSNLEMACRVIAQSKSNPKTGAVSVFQMSALLKKVLCFADSGYHAYMLCRSRLRTKNRRRPKSSADRNSSDDLPPLEDEPGHVYVPSPSSRSRPWEPPQVIGIISLIPNHGIQGRGNAAGNPAGVGVRPFLARRPDVSDKPRSVSTTPKSTPSPVNSVPEGQDVVPRDSVPTVPMDPRGSPDASGGHSHSNGANPRRPKHEPRIPIEEDPKAKKNSDEDWLRRYHNHILVVLAFGGLCCLYVIWHFGSGIYYEHLQRLALQSSSAGRTGGSSV